MSSLEDVVKFNSQTAGREKLLRLCHYIIKFVNSVLQLYYKRYAHGGIELLESIYKLRDLERYFISCRRLLNFGRCTDQFYSAVRSLQLYDPVIRTTLSTSKLSLSFQMFADHVLWLHQMGLMRVDKQRWIGRANKFWLYSVAANLLRDFYELICVIQRVRTREKDNLDGGMKFHFRTPLKWIRKHPKLSCDLAKNMCDFWIPYSAVNKINLHPIVISLLGIISTSMGMLQIYDKDYRLLPS